ncbi:hypothetical protein SPRG_14173 [Saprolegnia parasitica CBS 223.65]|uniref:Uncharacterized protein n=1 Tax=Saprolegnia parasitica (strain CBS 223.65) TaxID=695850 RepID=A0A067BT65_SAPPC|nr:hypothetical protein SPRG_14173 [Saprolegnia parasitica CBS 223.65]KDO20025.1 hypothetical protein SPRG_14173 [Saprolegnia parasitica CBS 223.65]|eukprot:XP_012209259.1 hypothetical protein SPRG_14173 [Saprolegnia parasitica CBS 223.65]
MLGVFDTLGVAVWIPLLDFIVLPRRQTRYGIRAVDKVAAGLLLSSATMVWVGLVDARPCRLSSTTVSVRDDGTQQPMNNLSWLMAVFYAHVPSHLKSCAQALNSFMMAMGDNLASICTLLFAPYITDNLNDGHLEYMLFALALLATLSALGFLLAMDKLGFGDMTTRRILSDATTTALRARPTDDGG